MSILDMQVRVNRLEPALKILAAGIKDCSMCLRESAEDPGEPLDAQDLGIVFHEALRYMSRAWPITPVHLMGILAMFQQDVGAAVHAKQLMSMVDRDEGTVQ